jgi:hypothetical protein
MAYRIPLALVASVSVAALMLACSTETFARSGPVARGGFTSHHPAFRHYGRVPGTFWSGAGGYYGADGGYYYDQSGEPAAEIPQPPVSNDVRYTFTNDVPWDWAHRYPPAVMPSDRPYVSTCPTESVTVPGRSGNQTINITRCY